MKRIYVKPETELVKACLVSMITASNSTEWHTGTDGQGDDNPIGGDQPDPNADAKGWSIDLWEDDDYNTWQ